MSTPYATQLAALDALYATLPTLECQRQCQESCGPVLMSRLEWVRIQRQIGYAPKGKAHLTCPLLKQGACVVHAIKPMLCFHPSTWIMTSHGAKRIAEVLAGDYVYGQDGHLAQVLATRSKLYAGPLINIRFSGMHMDCWCTPDHLWWTAFQKDKGKIPAPQWAEASSLYAKRHHKPGHYLAFPRCFEDRAPLEYLEPRAFIHGQIEGEWLFPHTRGSVFNDRMSHALPVKIAMDDAFLAVIGLYLAEGSSSRSTAQFTMHRNEQPVLERIGAFCATLGIKTHVRVKNNTAVLLVGSALFARLMSALCGQLAATKAMHPALLGQLSHAQKWRIYEAWDLGDGRQAREKNGLSTTTISDRLAMQMQQIALENGYFPRLYHVHHHKREGVMSWDVHLFPSTWRKDFEKRGTKLMPTSQYNFIGMVENGEMDYEGPVIDIEVEKSASFVTSSGIAHNCRLWGLIDSPRMRCPWGCVPERWLSEEEGAVFLDTAEQISLALFPAKEATP